MSTTSENVKVKKEKKKIIETVGIVSEMQRETPDTQTLRIRMPNLDPNDKPFQFKPGQFVMVRPEINGKVIPRAYSIASSPTRTLGDDGFFDLTVRQTENPTVSKWLNDRKVGDEILFRGPYGNFYWDETDPNSEQVFLAGGGSGVTPLKSIFEYIFDKGYANQVKLLYSVRTQADIISYKELSYLRDHTKNSKIVFTLTREPENSTWNGRRGRINLKLVQEELKDYDFNRTKCYLCGTPQFVETLVELLEQAGISHDRILHEKWD